MKNEKYGHTLWFLFVAKLFEKKVFWNQVLYIHEANKRRSVTDKESKLTKKKAKGKNS